MKNFHISFKSFSITVRISLTEDFTEVKKFIKNLVYNGKCLNSVSVGLH